MRSSEAVPVFTYAGALIFLVSLRFSLVYSLQERVQSRLYQLVEGSWLDTDSVPGGGKGQKSHGHSQREEVSPAPRHAEVLHPHGRDGTSAR